jgi:RNA polymerase sigma factor (TIGR02999 family)
MATDPPAAEVDRRSPRGASAPAAGEVTELLRALGKGRAEDRDRLVALVYADLRRMAARALRGERGDVTLQPTALVHETYQRLVDQTRTHWRSRGHFFAIAAGLMRRVLVDHARRAKALRRRGGALLASVGEAASEGAGNSAVDVLALDQALAELGALDPDQARLVELRYFCGLTVVETAEVLGVSRATVYRDWSMARAWLHHRLRTA